MWIVFTTYQARYGLQNHSIFKTLLLLEPIIWIKYITILYNQSWSKLILFNKRIVVTFKHIFYISRLLLHYFSVKGSALQQILYLDLNINKFEQISGSSYIRLPKDIKVRKEVINILNSDNKCFAYTVNAQLHHTHLAKSCWILLIFLSS